MDSECGAAVLIQAVWKGYAVRKEASSWLQEHREWRIQHAAEEDQWEEEARSAWRWGEVGYDDDDDCSWLFEEVEQDEEYARMDLASCEEEGRRELTAFACWGVECQEAVLRRQLEQEVASASAELMADLVALHEALSRCLESERHDALQYLASEEKRKRCVLLRAALPTLLHREAVNRQALHEEEQLERDLAYRRESHARVDLRRTILQKAYLVQMESDICKELQESEEYERYKIRSKATAEVTLMHLTWNERFLEIVQDDIARLPSDEYSHRLGICSAEHAASTQLFRCQRREYVDLLHREQHGTLSIEEVIHMHERAGRGDVVRSEGVEREEIEELFHRRVFHMQLWRVEKAEEVARTALLMSYSKNMTDMFDVVKGTARLLTEARRRGEEARAKVTSDERAFLAAWHKLLPLFEGEARGRGALENREAMEWQDILRSVRLGSSICGFHFLSQLSRSPLRPANGAAPIKISPTRIIGARPAALARDLPPIEEGAAVRAAGCGPAAAKAVRSAQHHRKRIPDEAAGLEPLADLHPPRRPTPPTVPLSQPRRLCPGH